jgi:hypothetical protein
MNAPPLQPIASGNEDRIRDLLEHLVAAFEEYCEGEEELPYIDAFMGVHNFHKAIVFDLAQRQELTAESLAQFVQMAADTFQQAMDEMKEYPEDDNRPPHPRGDSGTPPWTV